MRLRRGSESIRATSLVALIIFRRFDWPLSLRFGNGPDKAPRTAPIRRRTQRPEPPRRLTPSPPPSTPPRLRSAYRFGSGRSVLLAIATVKEIPNESHSIYHCWPRIHAATEMSMPPLTHSRHLRIGQITGDATNRTLSAVAFTRIPAQIRAEEAHTKRMG